MVPIKLQREMRSILRTAVLAFALGTVAGCAVPPLTQVKQFGAASKTLGDQARGAFELIASASTDRNLFDVAADPRKGPTDATFQGLFTGDVGSQDGKQKASRLSVRLSALEHLSNYSLALLKLAEADFNKDIDAASTELYGSLIGLQQTYKAASGNDLPITPNEIGIIATAINAIGKGVVEAERRNAIKTTIVKADPAVQAVANLIAADLGQDSELATFVRISLSNSRGSVQQAYNIERTRPSSTFDARYAMLVRARQLYDAESNSPAFFSAVSKGAAAIGATHSSLKKAVEKDLFSSTELAERIGGLEIYIKSVRSFYESIKATQTQ